MRSVICLSQDALSDQISVKLLASVEFCREFIVRNIHRADLYPILGLNYFLQYQELDLDVLVHAPPASAVDSFAVHYASTVQCDRRYLSQRGD